MRVFVAGATGAVGKRLIPQLITHGHQVFGTTSRAENVDALRALGATPVIMDGLDAAAVGQAVAAAEPEVIIHQMTALAGRPDLRRFDRWFAGTNRLRIDGTRNLLAAAIACGVPRFVAQSYTGWDNATTGGPIKTEDDQLEPDPPSWQRESLAAIRFLEEAVTGARLHGTVLRYGNFYGPGAWESSLDLVRRRRFPVIGDGGGVWSWIHIDDAAAATVAAIEHGRVGTYQVVDDDPAPVAEWLPYLAGLLGAKPPLRVPGWLGRLAAGESPTRWMTRARGASNAKIKNELGWAPTWASWRDGFRQALGKTVGPAADAVGPATTPDAGRRSQHGERTE